MTTDAFYMEPYLKKTVSHVDSDDDGISEFQGMYRFSGSLVPYDRLASTSILTDREHEDYGDRTMIAADMRRLSLPERTVPDQRTKNALADRS